MLPLSRNIHIDVKEPRLAAISVGGYLNTIHETNPQCLDKVYVLRSFKKTRHLGGFELIYKGEYRFAIFKMPPSLLGVIHFL
jgi:hypothetical protein